MMLFPHHKLKIDCFDDCPAFPDRLHQLRYACGLSWCDGLCLEFGVVKGVSITHLAECFPSRRFRGFDSFTGLPEDWYRSRGSVYKRGHFGLAAPPPVPENVELVCGYFDSTLAQWLERNPCEIGFVHADCDLYSSTPCVLSCLTDYLRNGAVIVFEELCDWRDSGVYPNWPEGEWKTLSEWASAESPRIKPISRDSLFGAAIQVFKP